MDIHLKVLDLSHHNDGPDGGPIDFEAIYSFGVRGIIHKSSQGVGNVDQMYAKRRQAALDAGLLWGAYHFADASDVAGQVQHFLDSAAPDDTTLLALDFEPNEGNTMSLDGARQFLQAIDKCIIYSGNLIKETLDDRPDELFGSRRLWLAQYGDHPKWPKAWAAPWLHQFSGDGVNNHGIHVPGVNANQSGKLDMNTYAFSDEQLAAEWSA